jgi:hypothetical protein
MPYHFADAAYDTHQFLEGPYMRVPKEIACAFTASALVSPIVSIMDKAMVQPITTIGAFMGSMGEACKEMVFTPKKFFGGLSFRLTMIALDYYNIREEDRRKQIKVSAASAANISLLAWRDSVFAREFGGSAVKRKTPMGTIAGFAVRDFFTMAATFYAAPNAAKWLIKEHDVNREVAELSMALAIPVTTQFATAPVHIYAMDLYNRPDVSSTERIAQIGREFNKICFARGLRILPAFGIGSYSNNKFRELTIRQPNEDLLLTRKVTKLIQRVTRPIRRKTEAK